MKSKGFTILELLLVMTLIAIITAIVFPFFNENMQAIDEVQKKTELRCEGENALERITKEAMESSKILQINGGEASEITTSSAITSITFSSADESKQSKFDVVGENLLVSTSTDAAIQFSAPETVAKDIKQVEIQPNTLTDINGISLVRGITVTITLRIDGNTPIESTISSKISFRN